VHSAAGTLDPAAPLVTAPPFCAPHHGSGVADLAGRWESGVLRPGAASGVHRGILFLDQAPEFDREALEVLRCRSRPGRSPRTEAPRTGTAARCRRGSS